MARGIHARSAQSGMPLVKVNCAAIPETLLESELFGHVRGAFTGAVTNKKGRFALADGGTIFLDEIGATSGALQAKLLRVLQEREFEPLGLRAQRAGRPARHHRHQPRPPADGRRTASSARTSTTASTSSRSTCRRCASGARTSRPRRALPAQARPAHGQAHRPRDAGGDVRADEPRLAGQRARAGERDRARGRAGRARDRRGGRSRSSGAPSPTAGLPSLQAAPEPGLGGEGEHPPGARLRARRQEGRGRDAGISQRALSHYLAKHDID